MPGNDGDDVWKAYAKGVKPLKLVQKVSSAQRRVAATPPPIEVKNIRRGKFAATQKTDFRAALDAKTERRLRQGLVAIEARLDLHGLHQDEAHKALDRFIAVQIKTGRRFLLVITGKGRGGEGVLRTALPGWLAASMHAAHILALRPAAIRHGGGGAFYVFLKRSKNRDL